MELDQDPKEESTIPLKRNELEQIVSLLRQIEVLRLTK
jgi:hypothetical protein